MESSLKKDTIYKDFLTPLQSGTKSGFLPATSPKSRSALIDNYDSADKKNNRTPSEVRFIPQYNLFDKSSGIVATGRLFLSPFSYSASNRIEGADIAGYMGRITINDNLSLNMSAYFSSGYFGYLVPDRIKNASLNLGVNINITDRLSVYGWGIVSVNNGIDPSYMPMIGPATGFGIGANYKLTENIFLYGGYQRSHYKGKWHDSFYVLPGYKWQMKKR